VIADQLVRWDWIGDHLDEIWSRSIQHVELTVVAVAIGLVLSFPMALVARRYRRSYAPITFVAGLLYTIPSLALFVLLIPATGLSTTTVEIGLVSYTLLILIRNIVEGLDGVPPDALDASTGMGYTARQRLWRVELPLALPVIVAGVRVATVTTIGLVTVGALIGSGGLGQFILRGLQTFDSTQTIVGAALSVVLAIASDALLLLLQRRLTPWSQRRVTAMPMSIKDQGLAA
jgi:osmoprotectant transport system permease protein